MKLYQYIIAFVSVLYLGSCTKDLGNYDYHEINDVKLSGFKPSYSVLRVVDTLRIKPVIDGSMDGGDTSRYRYLWIAKLGTVEDTIGRSRNLEYPVTLAPTSYQFYFRLRDRETGVEWQYNGALNVGTPYSRGWLLMGEDEQGYAEGEMLSMLNDTLHLKNILSASGLPRMRNPLGFVYTGGSLDQYVKVWALTKDESYYMDRVTMKGTTANNMTKTLYTSETFDPQTLHPIVIAPQLRTASGTPSASFYRVMITKTNDLFISFLLFQGGDYYGNPVNRVPSAQAARIPAAPYVMYPSGNMSSFMWYDMANQRFLNYANWTATSSSELTDAPDSPFPWNQGSTGRTLVYAENTRNTDGGSTNGNTFAIMKNGSNQHFIYKFYANGATPAKRAAYNVLPIARDFDKAKFYAFSSNRTVLFYSVGNKLYAYDYNPGNERFYEYSNLVTDEVTMLKFDTTVDHVVNSLYLATYNASTKATIRRFNVGTDPNKVDLIPVANSTWTSELKIKDMNWRSGN